MQYECAARFYSDAGPFEQRENVAHPWDLIHEAFARLDPGLVASAGIFVLDSSAVAVQVSRPSDSADFNENHRHPVRLIVAGQPPGSIEACGQASMALHCAVQPHVDQPKSLG